jgi:hypothetical protein
VTAHFANNVTGGFTRLRGVLALMEN